VESPQISCASASPPWIHYLSSSLSDDAPGADIFEPTKLFEAFREVSDLSPITKESLSELDIQSIINNIKSRHEVNFDRELSFRPNFDGVKGQQKRETADQYWKALEAELELYARLYTDGAPPQYSSVPSTATASSPYPDINRQSSHMRSMWHGLLSHFDFKADITASFSLVEEIEEEMEASKNYATHILGNIVSTLTDIVPIEKSRCRWALWGCTCGIEIPTLGSEQSRWLRVSLDDEFIRDFQNILKQTLAYERAERQRREQRIPFWLETTEEIPRALPSVRKATWPKTDNWTGGPSKKGKRRREKSGPWKEKDAGVMKPMVELCLLMAALEQLQKLEKTNTNGLRVLDAWEPGCGRRKLWRRFRKGVPQTWLRSRPEALKPKQRACSRMIHDEIEDEVLESRQASGLTKRTLEDVEELPAGNTVKSCSDPGNMFLRLTWDGTSLLYGIPKVERLLPTGLVFPSGWRIGEFLRNESFADVYALDYAGSDHAISHRKNGLEAHVFLNRYHGNAETYVKKHKTRMRTTGNCLDTFWHEGKHVFVMGVPRKNIRFKLRNSEKEFPSLVDQKSWMAKATRRQRQHMKKPTYAAVLKSTSTQYVISQEEQEAVQPTTALERELRLLEERMEKKRHKQWARRRAQRHERRAHQQLDNQSGLTVQHKDALSSHYVVIFEEV
jgi:hypothetical protein